MDIKRLASLIQRGTGRLLVIDSRTFSEYNASHVQGAVNVCCSKLVKRRLQQDKVSVTELLQPNGKVKVSSSADLTVDAFGVVGYDASDKNAFSDWIQSVCVASFHLSDEGKMVDRFEVNNPANNPCKTENCFILY